MKKTLFWAYIFTVLLVAVGSLITLVAKKDFTSFIAGMIFGTVTMNFIYFIEKNKSRNLTPDSR
ncbi:hypothetical protein [Metallibacterium scheffleri]|uniref:hypothetical protein n=1 Tax=Metallibacterium scheffleri TaxID=993689 RepID=UPI00109EFBDA|nr:hypothetical protein [Metallibacterium scheffleri]